MAVSEPAAKSGCVSTTITSRVYVWGGETESGDHLHLRNLYIFDTRLEEWRQRSINGDHPAGYNNCTATSQDSGFFYLYGGQDKDKKYTGSLHCLDLDLLIWRELSSHTHDGPKKKIDCGMVICGDKIILFGGLLEDGGYTNELHSFDLLAGIWLSPVSTGTTPPACRAFSLVKVGASTAMLFGGDNEGTASNQLFILELKNMHWSKVPHGDVWPEERFHHNGCCIEPDTDHNQLLITAGWKGEDDTYYNDIWLLDIKSMTWIKANEEVHAEITSPVEHEPNNNGHTNTSRAPSLHAQRKIYTLESQFRELVEGLKEYLQQNERELWKLRDIIQFQLPQRLTGIHRYLPLELISLENFSDFFKKLEDLWDFLDFDLLRGLIFAYENEELIRKSLIYEEKIKQFCEETTIKELIENWKPRFIENWRPRFIEKEIPENLKSLITELNWNPAERMVNDLKEIQKRLRKALPQELAMTAFYIREICKALKVEIANN